MPSFEDYIAAADAREAAKQPAEPVTEEVQDYDFYKYVQARDHESRRK